MLKILEIFKVLWKNVMILKDYVARRKRKYKNIEEWLIDVKRIREYPNDRELIQSIAKKIENSSTELRVEIEDKIVEMVMMERNPIEAFKAVMREHPECFLIVKSKNDPYFDC